MEVSVENGKVVCLVSVLDFIAKAHRMPDTELTVMTELHRNAHVVEDIEVGVNIIGENAPPDFILNVLFQAAGGLH